MRNRLCMKAAEDGFTHVVLIDNDVIVNNPESFVSMMRMDKEIQVPDYYDATHSNMKLIDSGHAHRVGIYKKINWAVISCVMFKVIIFKLISSCPFHDTFCYCEEETTFQRWRLLGAQAYQNLDAFMTLLRPPTNLWELKPDQLFRIQTPGDVSIGTIK